MADVFVSYSRKDQAFVRRLVAALQSVRRSVWVDWNDILPSAKWHDEINAAIDGADAFLFIISPDALASQVCSLELAHALDARKRIIPLLYRDVDAGGVTPTLSSLNWIFCRDSDPFDTAMRQLLFALDTDISYWHEASRLYVRAREWETKNRDRSIALRGAELSTAERWLADGARKLPAPTPLHAQFIAYSRQLARTRRRWLVASVSTVLLMAIVLSSVAAINFSQAQQGQFLLHAKKVATDANSALQQGHLDLALLLAAESRHQADTLEARSALLNAIEANPYVVKVLHDTNSSFFAGKAQLSADGRTLLLNADDGATVWDMTTQRPRAGFSNLGVTGAYVLSPTGRVAAVHGLNKIELWDTTTSADLGSVAPATEAPFHDNLALAFSPDGKMLAVEGCVDNQCAKCDVNTNICTPGAIALWDVQSRTPAGTIAIDGFQDFDTLAFSPDGKKLALSNCADDQCQTARITLWSVVSKAKLYSRVSSYAEQNQTLRAARLVFSPDGATLAVGGCASTSCDVGAIDLWNAATGAPLGKRLEMPGGPPFDMAYNASGKLFYATNAQLRAWETSGYTEVKNAYTDNAPGTSSFALAPDESFLAIGGSKKPYLLRPTPFTAFGVAHDNGFDGTAPAVYSADGKRVATTISDGRITIWDVATDLPALTLQGPPELQPAYLAFSPDGKLLAENAHTRQVPVENRLLMWDLSSGKQIGAPIDVGSSLVVGLAFDPDGSAVATFDFDAVRLWDARQLVEIQQIHRDTGDGKGVKSIGFSPDGRYLAVGADVVRLWDLKAKRFVATLDDGDIDHAFIDALAFTSDGKTLATYSPKGWVILWDVSHQREMATYYNSSEQSGANDDKNCKPVCFWPSLTISPDGHTLALSHDQRTLLLNITNGQLQPVANAIVTKLIILSTTISPDGRSLLTSELFGDVTQRFLTSDEWQAQACEIAGRNLTLDEWDQFVASSFGSDFPYHRTCAQWPDLSQ